MPQRWRMADVITGTDVFHQGIVWMTARRVGDIPPSSVLRGTSSVPLNACLSGGNLRWNNDEVV
jgi:hypothetical protein